jgi:hypothetical protein
MLFTLHSVTGKVIDFSNADVAVDHFHRYNVNLLKPFFVSLNRSINVVNHLFWQTGRYTTYEGHGNGCL